eukprot:365313-Chlamydomonas_euryale.AAC.23
MQHTWELYGGGREEIVAARAESTGEIPAIASNSALIRTTTVPCAIAPVNAGNTNEGYRCRGKAAHCGSPMPMLLGIHGLQVSAQEYRHCNLLLHLSFLYSMIP